MSGTGTPCQLTDADADAEDVALDDFEDEKRFDWIFARLGLNAFFFRNEF